MNEYDSNRIAENLKKINYIQTENPEEANCYILNTCHIREKATDKVYHDVGRVKKIFRNKTKPIMIIAGCVAQAEGEILMKKEKYIDGVIGPQSYHVLNDLLINIENKKEKFNYTEFEAEDKFDNFGIFRNSKSTVSSFLTIQEGCDKFCKFCVVPYTRGPEFSRRFDQIISEAEQLVNNGAKEIILLGQNVNAYNFDGKKLSDLIIELEKINNLKRIRYTTSHPNDMTIDLVKIHGVSKKLMPLLHIPVQSGSNKILSSMNRKHSREEYLQILKKLTDEKPEIKFSSDFIIAYPGETDEDFNQTIDLVENIKFINSYSYIFSPRIGTPAASLKLVDNKISKERLLKFQQVTNRLKTLHKKSLIGKNAKVLFENKIDKNQFFGRDEYNNSVIVNSKKNIIGRIEDVKLIDCNQNTIFGELLFRKKVAA